jgi:hypothetical protein
MVDQHPQNKTPNPPKLPTQRINFIDPSARPQYSLLPVALVELADIATNGECFWPQDAAVRVARSLAGQGQAITGGEVYCRRAVGWAAYLGEWFTSTPTHADASWEEFVALGLADALDAIGRGPSAWGEPGEPTESLRYFFASRSSVSG